MNLLTPELCRLARSILYWSQSDLASAAHLDTNDIVDFEAGQSKRLMVVIASAESALARAGVRVTVAGDGTIGLRIRKRRLGSREPSR